MSSSQSPQSHTQKDTDKDTGFSLQSSSQKPKSFNHAIKELEDISKIIDSQDIEIEDIAKYYARAVFLKKFCLERLKKIEIEIEKIDDVS
jgi:exodeoxyribonuclease VII small subunit